MNKAALLLTTALVAVSFGSASLARSSSGPSVPLSGAKVLYNQNSNDAGVGIDSQDFTSSNYSSYGDMGADDFIVPTGKVWKIGEVDAPGVYFNGNGPAKSENVIFWTDNDGVPGTPVKTYSRLSCVDISGSFACKLHKNLKLQAGHYWVTVQANMNYWEVGEWGWEMTSVIHNDDAQWEDPGSQCCCPTWGTIDYCIGYNGDLMFDLKGTRRQNGHLD